MPLNLLNDDDTLTVNDADLDGVAEPDSTVEYTIRRITPSVIERLRKQASQKRPNGRTMETIVDQTKFLELLWDHILLSWSPGSLLFKGAPVGADDLVPQSDGPVKARTLLDGARKAALLELAGINNRTDENRSFRPTPNVL